MCNKNGQVILRGHPLGKKLLLIFCCNVMIHFSGKIPKGGNWGKIRRKWRKGMRKKIVFVVM